MHFWTTDKNRGIEGILDDGDEVNFNPLKELMYNTSMDDSEHGESSKGVDNSDKNPFSKLDELGKEGVSPLDSLEDNTSMDDSKEWENTRGADDSDKNPSLSGKAWGRRGEQSRILWAA